MVVGRGPGTLRKVNGSAGRPGWMNQQAPDTSVRKASSTASAMTVDIRAAIEAQGLELLTAQDVADAVLDAFFTDVSGACWFVQPGRAAEPFTFRNVPGPRPTSRTSP